MAVRVGFMGLGNMGEGMASNLAKADFPLTVLDIRPEPVGRLVAMGAAAAADTHDLGTRSDIVCLALFDEAQVREACSPRSGARGLLDGMKSGGIVVVHSTVPPQLTQELARLAEARGIAVLDAPMTGGGDTAARAGKLTFFVGGDAATLERALEVLCAMSQNQFHVGDVGAGSTTKVLSNFLAISNTLVVREAMRLARAAGIDEAKCLSVINAGAVGSSWVSNNWYRIREQGESYTTGQTGMITMASKDLHLARDLARELGTPMPTLDQLIDHSLPELRDHGLTY